jgi:predicted transcriptional regulator
MQDLPGNPAYTTVQTILNIMVRKGRTKRIVASRTFVYRANVERETVQTAELASVLEKVFGGSVADLLRALLSTNVLDSEIHECIKRSLALAKRSYLPGRRAANVERWHCVANEGLRMKG